MRRLLSLRLVLRRMRQWPFVLEHLAEIAAVIHPPHDQDRRHRIARRLSPLRRDDALAIVIVLAYLGILISAAAMLYLT